MSAEEFDKLKADIQAQGLRHPILLHEDLILDGRHRARACAELGIVASFEQWTGNDPLAFVLSENLHRRHLTTDQRAAIGARLATRSRGGDRRSEAIKGSNDPLNPAPALTIDDAAKVMNVSPASVKRAKAKAALPAPVSLPPDACRSDDLEVTEADPTGPESAPVKRVSLPGQSGYSGANTRTAARLRRLASELESAMGSEQRTGVPLAEALALLRDIQATARGLAAILEKRLGEVDGAEVRT
jgi:ParB-like chromosome segregation protein Spo0J